MPSYTSIMDNSIINKTRLKQYLKIDEDDTSQELILDIALRAAKEAADLYCQDNFDPVPAGIEMWILTKVGQWWERTAPGINFMELNGLGEVHFDFNYDDFFHELKPYRREVGFW